MQPAAAALARSGRRWVVVTGPITDGVGCDVPTPVARDLLGRTWRSGCRRGARPRLARVYVTGTGGGGTRDFRPRTLLFGQRSSVIGIRWRGWGKARTVGLGRLEFNDCDPSCAEATPAYYPVRVALSRRELCDDVWQYRAFALRYTTSARPRGLRASYRETFRCSAPS